jgi:conjugative relaxase-like TrwC/TraI family protein
LGLGHFAEADQVERLAKGFHPITGAALVKGAGDDHVMGLDMTFSAPKDVSAIFAGADTQTRAAIAKAVQDAAKAALHYAESNTITRHGKAGKIKRFAEAAIAACYSHFSSRAGEPQLHIHGFLFNVGKRQAKNEWSALEHRGQFDRKMATGILFRVELASRVRALGFQVIADGPYFTIKGIEQHQRDVLSTRSKQIKDYLKECGALDVDGAVAREMAALNTRSAKAEPPLPELLKNFEMMAAGIGLTPETIAAMRTNSLEKPLEPGAEAVFTLNHREILDELVEKQSCVTAHEALTLICEKAMGQWNANECLAELDRIMRSEHVVRLGQTEQLSEVFTSKAMQDLEISISNAVADTSQSTAHHIASHFIDQQFDALEAELQSKLGVAVSLDEQRAAAAYIACQTGSHAFVEGWAGAGKTTMLKAVGEAYKAAGFDVFGCSQSAAASQNLARETGIRSRTIASLLLSISKGAARLGPQSILILDEAGMVGSHEFGMLQQAVLNSGGKLVAVGDAKQLQPIDAGGIFRSLAQRHGKAELSNIQRQKTDFAPLLDWLCKRGSLSKQKADVLKTLPENIRLQALESLCTQDEKLERAFDRWQKRFDYAWLREVVERFANGKAKDALQTLDERGRLQIISGHTATADALISDWAQDRTPIDRKTMIAATRAEVAALNAKTRSLLIYQGMIIDGLGLDLEITHRDESRETKRFAPGDRIVFSKNDKMLGVANGITGTIQGIEQALFTPLLRVKLDEVNERGEKIVMVPASFSYFDYAYCLTNHKSQGRTFDSAYTLANPLMCNREWIYVAASRSRYATTIYANRAELQPVDIESHREHDAKKGGDDRTALIEALALRMSRSRAKGTTLDYDTATEPHAELSSTPAPISLRIARRFLQAISPRRKVSEVALEMNAELDVQSTQEQWLEQRR